MLSQRWSSALFASGGVTLYVLLSGVLSFWLPLSQIFTVFEGIATIDVDGDVNLSLLLVSCLITLHLPYYCCNSLSELRSRLCRDTYTCAIFWALTILSLLVLWVVCYCALCNVLRWHSTALSANTSNASNRKLLFARVFENAVFYVFMPLFRLPW